MGTIVPMPRRHTPSRRLLVKEGPPPRRVPDVEQTDIEETLLRFHERLQEVLQKLSDSQQGAVEFSLDESEIPNEDGERDRRDEEDCAVNELEIVHVKTVEVTIDLRREEIHCRLVLA